MSFTKFDSTCCCCMLFTSLQRQLTSNDSSFFSCLVVVAIDFSFVHFLPPFMRCSKLWLERVKLFCFLSFARFYLLFLMQTFSRFDVATIVTLTFDRCYCMYMAHCCFSVFICHCLQEFMVIKFWWIPEILCERVQSKKFCSCFEYCLRSLIYECVLSGFIRSPMDIKFNQEEGIKIKVCF